MKIQNTLSELLEKLYQIIDNLIIPQFDLKPDIATTMTIKTYQDLL